MQSGSLGFQHVFNRVARVVHGVDAREAIAMLAAEEDIASVLLVTSPTVAKSSYVQGLRRAEPRIDRVYDGCQPHSPAVCVLEALTVAGPTLPDTILAVGGGSVIDTAKAVAMAMWNGIRSADRLHELSASPFRVNSAAGERAPRIVAVPTTLSAAELSPVGAMLDQATSHKMVIGDEYAIPRTIIYDPAALLDAPREILLGSGMKAIDHAAETLCALHPNLYVEPLAQRALELLGRALPIIADCYDARRQPPFAALAEAQLGCWMSVAGPSHGVQVGASHAIGHALGAICSVPHGVTSSIMLAPVLQWNHHYCLDAKRRIALALGGKPDMPAENAVALLVQRLGLPSRLAQVGVTRQQFDKISVDALADRYAGTNCRPISSASDIFEILELAA